MSSKPGKPRGARQERSAGLILFRRDKKTGVRRYLLLDYGPYWDFPKGHLEEGEDDRSAAARELEEETGIAEFSLVEGFEREIVYFFRHPRRGLIRKTVVFFLAETSVVEVRLSEEHVGSEWVAEEEAVERVKYPTAKKVLAEGIAFLKES